MNNRVFFAARFLAADPDGQTPKGVAGYIVRFVYDDTLDWFSDNYGIPTPWGVRRGPTCRRYPRLDQVAGKTYITLRLGWNNSQLPIRNFVVGDEVNVVATPSGRLVDVRLRWREP